MLLLCGTDDLSSGREPRLLCSHRRPPLCGCLSAAACAPYSAGGMDLGDGGNVVRVRLCPRYVTAQRETSASSWRSGYGDTSSPRSLRARAGFYGQLAWFWRRSLFTSSRKLRVVFTAARLPFFPIVLCSYQDIHTPFFSFPTFIQTWTDNATMISFVQAIANRPYASLVSSLRALYLLYVYLYFFVWINYFFKSSPGRCLF